MALTLVEIQAQARCNWCVNGLKDQIEAITEANFIDTGKTFTDSTPATAVYCNECLASDFRTSQPKSVLNRDTLNEIDIAQLQGA